jgi:hypothetical protein
MHLLGTDTLKKNGPQDLVTVFLCNEIAIYKMQLCSLSVAHTITLQPPWGTLFTMLTSANRSLTQSYMWFVVVRPVGRTAKFSRITLEVAYGREINIKFSGNSSDRHSCSQHANCMLSQNMRHLWLCVTKLHILVAFYCPSTRCTCVMIMLFNQLLYIPHLSGGWVILAREKC